MKPLRVFVGYDSTEPLAFHVLSHSILTRASVPVAVTPIARNQLKGIYTRERGPTESTEFSLTRFLVPYLSDYEGVSVFMDSDMLCLADIAELVECYTQDHAVWVVKHDYTPKAGTKFLGQQQTNYPRKNWSSLMVFDNARCRALSPDYVNSASGLELHRLGWLDSDSLIGGLDVRWNWLVGEYPAIDNHADPAHPESKLPHAKILHWTLGGPWYAETADCDYAGAWRHELARMGLFSVTLDAVTGRRTRG